MGVVEQAEHLAPHLRGVVGLVEVDAHRVSGDGSEPSHPRPLVDRDAGVLGSELEHAVAGTADGLADAQQLALVGVGARHQLAVLRPVERRAAGREPERTGAQRLLDQRAISSMSASVAGSLAAPRSPITKPRSGPCAICEPMSSTRGIALERVEVLGVALPLPGDALGHRGAGNVLDALHQRDQPIVSVGRGRREPDAAVAHHHGGDAVPARRCQPRVPGGLGVVVGVDVDEARRDQPAGGVDLAASERAGAGGLDRCDHAVVDDHIAVASRRTGAVDDVAVADDQVMHCRSPPRVWLRTWRCTEATDVVMQQPVRRDGRVAQEGALAMAIGERATGLLDDDHHRGEVVRRQADGVDGQIDGPLGDQHVLPEVAEAAGPVGAVAAVPPAGR